MRQSKGAARGAEGGRRPRPGLNRDRIGHRYQPYRYEVSREKLREFALATGVGDADYLADPADVDLGDLCAPPAFAATFTIARADRLLADPELGMHWNLVHSDQRFVFHRPVRGGDVLECTPWIVDIVDRGRMEVLTYQVDCTDARDGTPVVDGTSTMVLFGQD